MARIRTVKPDFWTDEDLATVCETARLVAIGLLNLADDEGYFNANPRLIECSLFPLTEPSVSIHECLKQLVDIGYIRLNEHSNGKTFGFITNFLKHQKVNRPTPSKIKDLFLCCEASLNTHGSLTVGKERKGKEQGKEITASAAAENSPVVSSRVSSSIGLPLQGDGCFAVKPEQIARLYELYPDLDCEQELRNMIGWFDCDPARLKPRTAIQSFINSWMANRQSDFHQQASSSKSQDVDDLGLDDTSWANGLVIPEHGGVVQGEMA